MDPGQELLDIFQRALAKLKALPQAQGLEIGAFTIILIFMATVIGMIVIACSGCCTGKSKKQVTRVQPV